MAMCTKLDQHPTMLHPTRCLTLLAVSNDSRRFLILSNCTRFTSMVLICDTSLQQPTPCLPSPPQQLDFLVRLQKAQLRLDATR
eukprot:2365828-Pleurochrysis_carterae.AAC.1